MGLWGRMVGSILGKPNFVTLLKTNGSKLAFRTWGSGTLGPGN
jgi:hypothetical protein